MLKRSSEHGQQGAWLFGRSLCQPIGTNLDVGQGHDPPKMHSGRLVGGSR